MRCVNTYQYHAGNTCCKVPDEDPGDVSEIRANKCAYKCVGCACGCARSLCIGGKPIELGGDRT